MGDRPDDPAMERPVRALPPRRWTIRQRQDALAHLEAIVSEVGRRAADRVNPRP